MHLSDVRLRKDFAEAERRLTTRRSSWSLVWATWTFSWTRMASVWVAVAWIPVIAVTTALSVTIMFAMMTRRTAMSATTTAMPRGVLLLLTSIKYQPMSALL